MPTNFNFTESGYVPSSTFDFGATAPNSYSILAGASNNFTSIWADTNASRSAGKMYISSGSAFTIIDLETKTVYDRYTQELKGRGNETLNTTGVVDLNVGP